MTGPLDGVRILDLTTMVSGPLATMMLAEQGADVVKVEPPAGDIMRRTGRRFRGMSASFLSCNRSKRSIAVDLKTPQGLEVARRLAAGSDMLVQNFRPGAVERMGLGEDAVRALNPEIVFVSISGFGEAGPYAHKRVYDPVIQALCGLAEIQADRDTGRPRMVRTIIPDQTTSVTAAQAMTAALFARERTGKGQHVRLSMLDTMVAFLWPEASAGLSFVGNEADPALGQNSPDLIFAAADGFITAGAVSDAEWAGMCRAFGREELIEDERFRTPAARVRNVGERRTIMSEEIAGWPAAEILARLDREGVPSAPVLARTEVIDDPQVEENRAIEIHDDPALGPVRQPRPAARFDVTPSAIRAMAPFLGADNGPILAGLGYDESEIEAMTRAGVLHREDREG